MRVDETAPVWAARGPSIFAPPPKRTKAQAAEASNAARLLKKPGRAITLGSPVNVAKRQIVIRTQADADRTAKIRGRV